jgi:rhodanese-related sulfurtransferase
VIRRLLHRFVDRLFVPDLPPRAPAAPPPPRAPSPPPTESPEPGVPLEVERPVPDSLLLDIREPGELAGGVAEGAMLLPMDLVPHHVADLPRDRPITVYCAAGARSLGVAHWLRQRGFAATSLAGGLGAVDVPVAVPPGLRPGTLVRVPAAASVDGATLGAELEGEVVSQEGDTLRVVVTDAQGFRVLVLVR